MSTSLTCPVCALKLQHRVIDGICLDVCDGGCGGIWFDPFELKKFDEPHEDSGKRLLDVAVDKSIRVDHRRKRPCPRCVDVTMMRRFYSPKRRVELDECGGCGGIWLDLGELDTIRAEYPSAEHRQVAINEFAQETAKPFIESLRTSQRQKAVLMKRLFGFVGIH